MKQKTEKRKRRARGGKGGGGGREELQEDGALYLTRTLVADHGVLAETEGRKGRR